MKKGLPIIIILLLITIFGAGTVSAASAPKLNKTSVTIKKGKTCKLTLKGAKAKKVKWSSRNKKIATVKNGLAISGRTAQNDRKNAEKSVSDWLKKLGF